MANAIKLAFAPGRATPIAPNTQRSFGATEVRPDLVRMGAVIGCDLFGDDNYRDPFHRIRRSEGSAPIA